MLQITEENFAQEVEQSPEWCLLDFYADWCGPCRMIAPMLEEIIQVRSGLKIGKLNVDSAPQLAQRFQVMSIPTLILFHSGKAMATWVGLRPKAILLQDLDKAMAG